MTPPAIRFGLDTFGDSSVDEQGNPNSDAQTIRDLVDQAILADQLGLDNFNVGEHHRDDFAVSAPDTVLAGIATVTKNIMLGSGVTVLSSEDPVRVYQSFATLDALSNGRAVRLPPVPRRGGGGPPFCDAAPLPPPPAPLAQCRRDPALQRSLMLADQKPETLKFIGCGQVFQCRKLKIKRRWLAFFIHWLGIARLETTRHLILRNEIRSIGRCAARQQGIFPNNWTLAKA